MNTTKGIKIHDTVWVELSSESGYAEVVDMCELPASDTVMYAIRLRGSDDVVVVNEDCVTPLEDTMHDKHYRDSVVEPILVMQDFFSHEELIGFLKGNILKYRLRAGHKGTEEELQADLDKICVYEKWLDAVKNGERIEL